MADPHFQAGGALRDGAFYLERGADEALFTALRDGHFCNVLAPRQVGKTSLAQRTARRLDAAGVRTASVDLTGINIPEVSAEMFFTSVADELGQELGADALGYFREHDKLTPTRRLLGFLLEQVRGAEQTPLVIFVDEIDVLLRHAFADDFFAALRSIYNRGARDPESARLTFCLIGVLVPLDLTQDPHMTPFNIGREIVLSDFLRPELTPLTAGLAGLGAPPEALLDEVFRWTQGHPALTQFLCEELVKQGQGPQAAGPRVDELVRDKLLRPLPQDTRVLLHIEGHFAGSSDPSSTRSRPPPDAALRDARQRDTARRMLGVYSQILEGRPVAVKQTDPTQIALRRLGLVSERDNKAGGSVLVTRSRIFEKVFDLKWVREHQQSHDFTNRVYRWVDGGRTTKDLLDKPADIARYEKWAQRRSDLTADERDFLVDSKSRLERRQKWEYRITVVILVSLGFAIGQVAYLAVRKVKELTNAANHEVLEQKRRLGLLRGDYESMTRFPERRATVGKEAPEIAAVLSAIDDPRLSPHHRIVKYQYACFAHVMAAAAFDGDEKERDRRRYYTDAALFACRRGLELFEHASQSTDKAEVEAAQWAREDNGHNRMRYLRAMALSMKAALAASGEDGERAAAPLRAEALAALGEVEQTYRRRSQPMETRELGFICPKKNPPSVCEP